MSYVHPYSTGAMPITHRCRIWSELTAVEQEHVKEMLTPDPDDGWDELAARIERARQIMRGEETVPPRSAPNEIRIYLNDDGTAYASANGGPVIHAGSPSEATETALDAAADEQIRR